MNHIGNKIKEYRNTLGITQKELAERLNVKQQTVAYYENCDALTLDRINEISNALGVPALFLLFDEVPAESFDTFQQIENIKTRLSLLSTLITLSIEKNDDFIYLPTDNQTLTNDNLQSIKIDELIDALNQSVKYFNFLISQKD